MEKTPTNEPLVHDGKICATCAYLDGGNEAFCRRFPPITVGGVIMTQSMASREPQAAIMKNSFFPAIGAPALTWCGEWQAKPDTTPKVW